MIKFFLLMLRESERKREKADIKEQEIICSKLVGSRLTPERERS